jgi:hypothetical protein
MNIDRQTARDKRSRHSRVVAWSWGAKLALAAATILISIAVATPAFAWPMCGY